MSQSTFASNRRLSGFIRFISIMIITIVALFELQPWLDIGTRAADVIDIIPFFGFIRAIPVIGGILSWVVNSANIASALAIGFWYLVNKAQLQSLVSPINRKTNPELWFRQQLIKFGSLFIQLLVSFLASIPYKGGWNSLSIDLPVINPSLIDWQALIVFCLFLYSFEFTCLLMDWSLGWNPISDGWNGRRSDQSESPKGGR